MSNPAARNLWPWVWGVLGAALILRTAVRSRGVIYDHIEFGRRLIAGEDLYAPYLDAPRLLHPVYPPSFGLMTWPFSIVPDALARTLWAGVQVAALAWISVVLLRTLRSHWPDLAPRANWILCITLLLASRYVLRDTHGGGGNLINLALVLGSLDLARRGKHGLSGLALGVSLATKPTAVLFVPLLMVFGHGRAAMLAMATGAGLLGFSLLLHGNGLAPLETWVSGSVAYARTTDLFEPPIGGFPPFTWMNQCLRCALARYLGEVPAEFTVLRDGSPMPGWFDGLGWSDSVVGWIRAVASAVIVGSTFAIAWRARRAAFARLAVIGACFAASLLVSPISWKAHHVALIPALFLLSIRVVQGTTWALVLAIAYVLTCVAGEELVGKGFKHVQQQLYLVTFGTLALWILCLGRAFWPAGRIRDGQGSDVR